MAETADWKVSDLLADGFGVGDNRRGNFEQQFANPSGIGIDGGGVELPVFERILQGVRAEEMKPGITLSHQNGQRLLNPFSARNPPQFADASLHFRKDHLLLVDNWIFELRVRSLAEALAKIGMIERVE